MLAEKAHVEKLNGETKKVTTGLPAVPASHPPPARSLQQSGEPGQLIMQNKAPPPTPANHLSLRLLFAGLDVAKAMGQREPAFAELCLNSWLAKSETK